MPDRREFLRTVVNASGVGFVRFRRAGAFVQADADGSICSLSDVVQERPFRGARAGEQLRIDGFDLCWCPPGRFLMGSPPGETGHRANETRVEVRLTRGFWMAKFEVTQSQWRRIVGTFPAQQPSAEFGKGDEIPVYWINFDEAEDFCTRLTERTYRSRALPTGWEFRLPTEAQWEYACRAGTETAYYFGDDAVDLDQYAWHKENAGETTPHVGLKEPNPWGLHDMHGNVAEWVLDEYSEEGYQKFEGKKVTADEAIRWPTDVYPRVVRGGSWKDSADRLRSAARMGSAADSEWKFEDPNFPLSPWWFTSSPTRAIGFRIMRPLEEPTWEEMQRYWEADVEDLKLDVEDRLWDGQGVKGLVDPELPEAIRELREGR
jgi:formylglycine-generating enzyme